LDESFPDRNGDEVAGKKLAKYSIGVKAQWL
jgi:hypothetical protein